MAFKGLEDRFLANAHKLYTAFSTTDGPNNSKNNQPFLEWKPTDPSATEQTHDTQFLPIGAIKRDTTRMGDFLKSNDGLLFLVKQEVQQLGNTFSETQIINPLFVIGNVIPGIHIPRSLTFPSSFAPSGDMAEAAPFARDPDVQGSGRLQKASAADVKNNILGKGTNSLISLLPMSSILNAIKDTFSLSNKGSLGINERPELDINGQYFSVMLWQGYTKRYGSKGALETAAANLRKGNLTGALDSLKTAGKDLLGELGFSQFANDLPGGINGRVAGSDSRYFITGKDTAIRYVKDSVTFDGNVPHVNLQYLNRHPSPITKLQSSTVSLVSTVSNSSLRNLTKFTSALGLPSFTSKITSLINDTTLSSLISGTPLTENSSTLDHLAFPDSALQNVYTNDFSYIPVSIDAQQKEALARWETEKNTTGLGSVNGNVQIGIPNVINPNVSRPATGYLRDQLNSTDIFDVAGPVITTDDTDSIYANGTDLIKVLIHDVVNKKVLPFRAFITDLRETISPDITDTRYIGRTERNVVYSGVTREVAFKLYVHAFHEDEMATIWSRINYMTGLCYPAMYSQGFMVPPLVRFTIGNVYKNQPGYIRSLSHTIEDGTVWDIDKEAPTTVVMDISISLIDAQRKTTGQSFYSVG